MKTLLELSIELPMAKIYFIIVVFAKSILPVPVTETTDLPVDRNVDPCDDFYEFTCARFIHDNPSSSLTQFSIVDDLMEEKLKTLLEAPVDVGEQRHFQLAKSMYQACMNTNRIEAIAPVALEKIIKNTGGWPVVEGESWNAGDVFNWQITAYQLLESGFELGYNAFFQVSVDSHPRNSTSFLVHIMQPTGSIPYKLMKKGWDEPVVKAYYEYLKKVAKKLGADRHDLDEELKGVIDLEIAISKIKIPEEEKRDLSSTLNLMTIQDMHEKYPFVDWLSYIDNVMHHEKKGQLDDVVNVEEPKYLQELNNVLEVQTQRNLVNYMYWQAILSVVDYMDDEMREWELSVTKLLDGIGGRPPRWQQCTATLISKFGVAVGALYVRNFFDAESKTAIADMVDNVKSELKDSINELHWMDDATKEQALKKSEAMQSAIAYPDELLDDTKIENYYQKLQISEENYLESMLNVTAMRTGLSLNIDQPLGFISWQYFNPVAVNALYHSDHNTFQIFAGFLQGAFFSSSRPPCMNYGSIGIIIGHEMMHGFDDLGSQYDKNGNLADWWQSETKKTFVAKTKCIIDQYGNFTVPEVNLKLNGINTQGENIADNVGVKLAYLACKKWAANHEKGLEPATYTTEQLFWISYGMSLCSNSRAEQLKMDVLDDTHSPHRYRVNVPLMNSEYFAKDFNCPIGSAMNPKNKCIVW